MAETEIGNLAVKLSLDSAGFERSMASIDRSLKTLGQEMRINQNRGREWGNSITGLTTKQESLTRMLSSQEVKVRQLHDAYERSKAETGENSRATENLATQLNRATAEYTRTETELNAVREALRRQQDELRLAENGWNRLGESLTAFGASAKKVGDNVAKFGKDLSMKITAPIVAIGTLSAKAAIDFESAFAGIKKTVDATDEEFAELEKGIRDMAKAGPSTAAELAAIGESAGQLGIATENILSFTSTVSDIATATNLTAEQAATDFARFANITSMPQTEFDKLGSSIVALGNTMATTESEIMSMSMRLAAQGSQVGMSEAQITALAATMSSLGIEAEAGGTAMTTVLKKIDKAVGEGGKSVAEFAQAAGVSSKEFTAAWESDPIVALDMFIKGLSKSGEEGKNLSTILQDLGIKGIRESDTLLRMAGASDLLSDAVATSSTAWKENTALTDEAAQRYATTASQLETFKNKLVDIGITLGDIIIPAMLKIVEAVEPWIEKFAALGEETQKTILIIAGIAAAIGPVLVVLGTITSAIGSLLTAFGTISSAIAVVKTGVASAVPAVSALAKVFTVLTGPVGIAIGIITTIAGLGVLIYKNWEPIKAFFADLWTTVKESASVAWEWLKSTWGSSVEWITGAWATVSEFFTNLWTTIQESATNVWTNVLESWNLAIETMKLAWDSLKLFFIELWISVVETVMVILQPFIDNIINVFNGMKDGVAMVFEGLSLYFTGVWDVIKNIFLGALLLLINLVTGNFEELKSNATQIMDNIKTAMFDIWEGIKLIFSGALDAVVGFAKSAWDNIKNDTTTVFNAVKSFIGLVWDSIKLAFNTTVTAIVNFAKQSWENIKIATSTAFNAVRTLFSTIWNGIKTFFTTTLGEMWTSAKQKFDDIKNSVKTKMDEAKQNVIDKWNEAQKFLTDIDLKKIGMDIIDGLINGIRDKIGAVTKAVTEVTDAITGKIKDILKIASPSKVMIGIGDDTGEGLNVGLKKSGKRAIETISNIAKSFAPILEPLEPTMESLGATAIGLDDAKSVTAAEKVADLIIHYLITGERRYA